MIQPDRIDRWLGKRNGGPPAATCAFALILATCLAAPVWAQYDISWYTVDGGGSRSSGGVFEITGTIGQPDAGLITGGVFTLGGGFWTGGRGTVDVTEALPVAFSFALPAPNPLVQRSVLAFELPEAAEVDLAVHDVAGRVVRVLAKGRYPAGRHQPAWDGTDAHGSSVAPGVYFVRFAAGPYRAHRKLLVIR